MRTLKASLEVQEERARRAGLPLVVWQQQNQQRVSRMRARALERKASTIDENQLSESQQRALRRMTFAFVQSSPE